MSDDDRHPCEEEESKELELERQEIRAKMDAEEKLQFQLDRAEEDEAFMSDDDYCPLRPEEVSKELELEREKILAEVRAEERESNCGRKALDLRRRMDWWKLAIRTKRPNILEKDA